MAQSSRTKFIHDVQSVDDGIRVRKPFKLEHQEQRRFVRLQISAPLALRKIRDIAGNFWPDGDRHLINGVILNISEGGVLVETDQPINEGDIVLMRFTLQDVESLDNVLGLAKRADLDDGCFLIGIEFITRSFLADIVSKAEMDMLSDKARDFDTTVRDLLNKYVHRERIAAGPGDRHEAR